VKGQTQAITATLITTVIVAAIATAYVWGGPLLQKGQAEADLEQVESEVMELYDKILEVSNSGSGAAETVSLELDTSSGNTDIQINEEKNFIDIRTNADNIPYPGDTWTLIRGQSLQNLSIINETDAGDYGIGGEDSPGVVAVEPVSGAGERLITYRIEFRNLLTQTPEGTQLRKVDLQAPEGSTASGDVQITLSNRGTEFDSGEDSVTLSTGESIERQRTVVDVTLR